MSLTFSKNKALNEAMRVKAAQEAEAAKVAAEAAKVALTMKVMKEAKALEAARAAESATAAEAAEAAKVALEAEAAEARQAASVAAFKKATSTTGIKMAMHDLWAHPRWTQDNDLVPELGSFVFKQSTRGERIYVVRISTLRYQFEDLTFSIFKGGYQIAFKNKNGVGPSTVENFKELADFERYIESYIKRACAPYSVVTEKEPRERPRACR